MSNAMMRLTVAQEVIQSGVLPIFYHQDLTLAAPLLEASAAGGARVFEWTNRGPGALRLFEELRERAVQKKLSLKLGVGSIVDAPTAAAYINAGAEFVVGPCLSSAVADVCNRRKVSYVPGCGSVTEINEAHALGCEFVKLFPAAEVGGPSFVKAVRGPMPWTSVIATGGVDLTIESFRAWFEAGTTALGLGSNLFAKSLLDARDFKALEQKMAQALQLARQARGG
jgi:2-dehydro-3-deoxyphosphogluconate aldolase/(4S)-4-hydroxy-2-oxoglutarate aldolase